MVRNPEDRSVIFMNSTLISKISKNKLEEIRISVLKNNKIDIRTYYYFPNEKEPKPTKKGIWLSFKHIPPILSAYEKYVKDASQEFKIEFEMSQKEKIRTYLNDYMKNKLVHIRTFYLKDNEFNPGKGISFSTALLPQFIETFQKLKNSKF